MKKTPQNLIERPPVIVIMGHIDHGKSTLLDYIRKSNIVEKEAGGITQHVSAYEVKHLSKDGKEHLITFLDTPGHEAFCSIRIRGAKVADIAILVVSAEDGVKPQTIEALKCIKEEEIPYIVAINKIDKPSANIEKTKQNLSENEIYLEGMGGDIPFVPISAKKGDGINELMDITLLVAEIEELKGDLSKNAEGSVIESNLDPQKGISSTVIIKNGALRKGMFVATDDCLSPIRSLENFLGEKVDEAHFSSPIRIVGWSSLPKVGQEFRSFESKKEAEAHISSLKNSQVKSKPPIKKTTETVDDAYKSPEENTVTIPIILKADVSGSLEALKHEIEKIKEGPVKIQIISSGIGAISEGDVKLTDSNAEKFLLGFNVKIDPQATSLAERLGIEIKVFNIIYKVTEWLEETILVRTPKIEVEESIGLAKILKIFSENKDKQVVGGKVEKGLLAVGSTVKITRREANIGNGKIRGLQQQKNKTSEVREGFEFGAMIESKTILAPGDRIESFKIVTK